MCLGDVCVSRRSFGRHLVFPLHADICVLCRKIGFDNLNPIIWYKIANASFEVENGSKFLGKPYEPNAIINIRIGRQGEGDGGLASEAGTPRWPVAGRLKL